MRIEQLNEKLANITDTLNISNLTNSLDTAASAMTGLKFSAFGGPVGQSLNGVKTVNQVIEIPVGSIATLPVAAPLVTLTENIPGQGALMAPTLTAAQKVLIAQVSGSAEITTADGSKITPKGATTAFANGRRKASVLAGTPESIQSNIKTLTGTLPDFNLVMKDLVPTGLSATLKNSLASVANLETAVAKLGLDITGSFPELGKLDYQVGKLTNGLGGLGSVINREVYGKIAEANKSLNMVAKIDETLANPLGYLQDVKLTVENHIESRVNEVTHNLLEVGDAATVLFDIKNENSNKAVETIQQAAVRQSRANAIGNNTTAKHPDLAGTKFVTSSAAIGVAVQEVFGLPSAELINTISGVTTSLSDNIQGDGQTASSAVIDVDIVTADWDGANTLIDEARTPNVKGAGYMFARVNSAGELLSELANVDRDITSVIVHYSGHFKDQPHVGAIDLHHESNKLNLAGCAYHYIIKRNGDIERGRPVAIAGQHAKGHNANSIGLVFIGGINNFITEQENATLTYGSENFTSAQHNSFKIFMTAYYTAFEGGLAFGHQDVEEEWAIDPGFDVSEYVKNNFNKINHKTGAEAEIGTESLVTVNAVTTGSDALNKPEKDVVVPKAEASTVSALPMPAIVASEIGPQPAFTVNNKNEAQMLLIDGINFNHDRYFKEGDIIIDASVLDEKDPARILRIKVTGQINRAWTPDIHDDRTTGLQNGDDVNRYSIFTLVRETDGSEYDGTPYAGGGD